jgi:hypothetical protein
MHDDMIKPQPIGPAGVSLEVLFCHLLYNFGINGPEDSTLNVLAAGRALNPNSASDKPAVGYTIGSPEIGEYYLLCTESILNHILRWGLDLTKFPH